MAHYCSECTYLDTEDEKDYKFLCTKKYERVYANNIECSRYCPAYSRSDSEAQSAYDYSKRGQTSTGCFITTTLCGILLMADDNEYLNTLRKFRKEVLQTYNEGLEILVKYDEVGPRISKCLSESTEKSKMACILFNKYIVPITEMIESREYQQAIDTYTEMTNKLIEFFKIDDTVKTSIDEVEPSLCGHGRLVKKMA